MKTLTKTFLCVIGLSLVPLALSAANEQASTPEVELPEYKIEASLPQPTHQPIPQIKSGYVGLDLKLKFTVNEKGRPESVRLEKSLSSYSDIHKMSFASQMRDLVTRWKFEPARDANGQAVAVKVIMPVQVIKKGTTPTAIATLILDKASEG